MSATATMAAAMETTMPAEANIRPAVEAGAIVRIASTIIRIIEAAVRIAGSSWDGTIGRDPYANSNRSESR